jgi:peptide/nickel transport system substrate-binding protein
MNLVQFSVVSLLACQLFLGACVNSKTASRKIVVALPTLKLVLDPHKMRDAYSMAVNLQIYRGLFRYLPDGRIAGDLAKSWTVSANKKIFKITLKNSNFSDGRAITAKNVINSFARIFYLGASMSSDLSLIVGFDKFLITKKIDELGIRLIDNNTLEFQLRKPNFLFIKLLAAADCAILPISRFDESLSGNVFSGPYKVILRDENQIVLEKWRSDSYDAERPPEIIEYRALQLNEISAQKINAKFDTIEPYAVDAAAIKPLLASGWQQFVGSMTSQTFVMFNPEKIDRPLRDALWASLNITRIVDGLGVKQFSPAFGLVPSGLPGHLTVPKITIQPNLRNIRGERTIFFSKRSGIYAALAIAIATIWRQRGMVTKLVGLETTEYIERLTKGKYEIIIGNKGLDYPDGYSILSNFRGNIPDNYFFVNDKQIDLLLDKAPTIEVEAERYELYKVIQKKILNKHIVLPIYFGSQDAALWSSNVKAVPSHPMGFHTLALETVNLIK